MTDKRLPKMIVEAVEALNQERYDERIRDMKARERAQEPYIFAMLEYQAVDQEDRNIDRYVEHKRKLAELQWGPRHLAGPLESIAAQTIGRFWP